ncbi:MAG: hypothetical protein WC373_05640 [Smithella sp.]|jgi:hypothetical protein
MLKPPKTFYTLQAVARMMGIPKDTVNDAFNHGIDAVEAIKPIAHLFTCFREGDEVSYAILKKHFEKWRTTGQVPKVSTGRPPKWKNNENYTQLRFDCDKETYGLFKAIVDKANSMSSVKVGYRDMLRVAIQEFNDRREQILGGDG